MKRLWLVFSLFQTMFLAQSGFCQNTLQITSVKANDDGAILLYWDSNPNEVYEVDYADAVADISQGGITWQPLVTDYASHGATTFVADNGNFNTVPGVPHPKSSPMRYYRVVKTGTETGAIPSVNVLYPADGQTLSGQVTVTVSASTSMNFVNTSLYVDGQEMEMSDDNGSYVINTCEWANGPHIIFALATAQSALPGPTGSNPITIGYGASPYVTVNFNNLISKISFSEPFFQPSLGQTQHVTAKLAANSDWTIHILDKSSNAVRTVTGSGSSLAFDWDGVGSGGTNIPDGVYMFSFSAQTNGLPIVTQSSSSNVVNPPIMSMALVSLNNEDDGLDIPVPPSLPLESGFSFTPPVASRSRGTKIASSIVGSDSLVSLPVVAENTYSTFASSGFGSGQTTLAPTKPPTNPVKGISGTIGVAFYDWKTTKVYKVPKDGKPYPATGKIQINGSVGDVEFNRITDAALLVARFATKMEKAGYRLQFNKSGGNLQLNDIRSTSLGGSSLFGTVNLGLFVDHGNYGTSMEYHADSANTMQTYFASDNPADAASPWIRLSEFGFDGGNLRWMAILACDSLRTSASIIGQNKYPLKSENHLLCGLSTYGSVHCELGELWAQGMVGKYAWSSPKKIKDAWFDAGTTLCSWTTNLTETMVYRVTGWQNCMDDTLSSYPTNTTGSVITQDKQVSP